MINNFRSKIGFSIPNVATGYSHSIYYLGNSVAGHNINNWVLEIGSLN
jgi:hypothetical protein